MKDPVRVGESAGQQAVRLGLPDPRASAKLYAAWESIAGPEVAARFQPALLKGGVLRLRTDSPAWAAQVRYLVPQILLKVSEVLGEGVVTEVRTQVVKAGSGPKKAASEAPPRPLDRASESDVREAEKLASEIPDERLAEAVKNAHLAAKTRRSAGARRGKIQ